MTRTFSWTAGIRWGISTVGIGLILFVLVSASIDYPCTNSARDMFGCRVYHGYTTALNWYTDIFRRVVAPRCIGGQGPDDCLGPDAGIMIVTLFTIGYVYGGFRSRKATPTPKT